jgi:hypothetical protein
MKLGILAPEPISTSYSINPSDQSVCLYLHPRILARQQLHEIVTAATNTEATIEEFLEVQFSMRSVWCQRKVGDYFFPELIVLNP